MDDQMQVRAIETSFLPVHACAFRAKFSQVFRAAISLFTVEIAVLLQYLRWALHRHYLAPYQE